MNIKNNWHEFAKRDDITIPKHKHVNMFHEELPNIPIWNFDNYRAQAYFSIKGCYFIHTFGALQMFCPY